MIDEFDNGVNLNNSSSMPVGEFGTAAAPNPLKSEKDDLSALISKLTKSIEEANKRQASAKKARDTIESKSNDDKFKKVALRLAEGRLGRANKDVEDLRRQLADILRTQLIKDAILKDEIAKNERLEEQIAYETKKDNKKISETLQDTLDTISKNNQKFEKAVADVTKPIKELTANNELFLGDIASDFSRIFNTVSSTWSQFKSIANSIGSIGIRGAKLVDKLSAKKEKSKDETEVSVNESYTLKDAVNDIKESNSINTSRVLTNEKIESVKRTRSTNKYLRSIKDSVNRIKNSVISTAAAKFALIALMPMAIAEIVGSIKKIWDNRGVIIDAITTAITTAISKVTNALRELKFIILRSLQSVGNSLIDMGASKLPWLANARYKKYEKVYDIDTYEHLKKSDRVTYVDIKSKLDATKETREKIAKMKAEGASYEDILAAQREYIQSLMEDENLSLEARQYLAGMRDEELQAPEPKVKVIEDASTNPANASPGIESEAWYPKKDGSGAIKGSDLLENMNPKKPRVNPKDYDMSKPYYTEQDAIDSMKPAKVEPAKPEPPEPPKKGIKKTAKKQASAPAVVNNTSVINNHSQSPSVTPQISTTTR